MKANELRIGNIILSFGTNGNPNEWVEMAINADNIKTCETHPDLFKPIPLTEEWLLKFGFKKHLDTLWIHWSNKGGLFEISTRLPEGSFGLHQLQNLYFAITEQELTIKKNEIPATTS